MSNIRVFIAEDHKLVRAGLALLIDSEPDMTVVGEANNGRQAIDRVPDVKPDVVVMDMSMPEVSGLVAAAAVKQMLPSVDILILTRHNDIAYLQELLQVGISGYVLKQSDSEEMLRAIRVIASGEQYMDPAITDTVFWLVRAGNKCSSGIDSEVLNERETNVLRRVAFGYSNKQIADQLATSIKTIESQKASALRKLNLKDRNQIVNYAILRGWLAESHDM
ncbi:MAG TPA: response regulator transcription factor [Pyrinomonadaceae bacterium]|nr:response regulator transcription factor [Pyrinomonadaceae bacterium]